MKTQQQGEVYIQKVDSIPTDQNMKNVTVEFDGNIIISHSEKGHNHVLDSRYVDVLERTENVPAGMRILYAIVKDPTALIQTAATPHEAAYLEPGTYELIISREFNPFLEEARMVAD